jgi:transposase
MARPTYQQLREENRQLRQENRQLRPCCEQLEWRVADLEAQILKLTQLLEQVQRRSKRQAAPFSKGPPKSDPKSPGRKAGRAYGRQVHRPTPPPDQIDEVYEACLPSCCPDCGQSIKPTRVDQQYQVDIPRRPIYRQFNVHIGRCLGCGKRVQGRHERQTSDALGAARSQLGPEAQAAVVYLNKVPGLSHGKVTHLFKTLFGIDLSPGGSVRIMLRVAQHLEPTYQAIVKAMPHQPWTVADETGWRIGGLPAWLHAFVTESMTCYRIARSRGFEIAQRLLGWDYAGVLIHDGWASYDRFWRAMHQTCLAHLLRRCGELLATARRGAVRFPRQVKALLQDSLNLRDRYEAGELTDHGLAVARGRLQSRLDQLLKWTRINRDNERFAAHLAKHRHQIFTFLQHVGIDATNWRAEQAIRPAVVNRKVWGGNRTEVGGHAQEIHMTVLRTCSQQAVDSLDFIRRLLLGHHPRLALPPP